MARDGFVRMKGEDLGDKLTPQELSYVKGQDVVAVNCTYLGESLAALVFFRDAKSPFTEDDESLLKAVSPIFAVNLATVVRGAEDEVNGKPDDDSPFFDGAEGQDKPENKKKPKKENKDAADWWKRGEDPPF